MVYLGAVEEGYLTKDAAKARAQIDIKYYKLYCIKEKIVKDLLLKVALEKMFNEIETSNEGRRWTEAEIKEKLDQFVGVELLYYWENKYDERDYIAIH